MTAGRAERAPRLVEFFVALAHSGISYVRLHR